MSTWFQVVGFHTVPSEQEMKFLADDQSFGCHTNASATKDKIVQLSRHVELFHSGIQQRLGGSATRVLRVGQIIDMGDRDKGEPTIEFIEVESPFSKALSWARNLLASLSRKD